MNSEELKKRIKRKCILDLFILNVNEDFNDSRKVVENIYQKSQKYPHLNLNIYRLFGYLGSLKEQGELEINTIILGVKSEIKIL
ncbi:MAG: hypothetical protein PUE12_08430 [Oscillospiraceae bacterium]|nr:hypothetical protein [Oscillospiraceae bacterium]